MENIGKEITQEWEAKQKITRKASRFRVLQFIVEPPGHIIRAEVALFNDAGECIGPAKWVQLNPIQDGEKEIDNWGKLVKMTLVEINKHVKAALQNWEM